MFKKNKYNIISFIILCAPPLIMLAIYSPSSTSTIIFCEIFIIAFCLLGYFSVGKNIKKYRLMGENDLPQTLRINGIPIELTVKTIIWLKFVCWSFLYMGMWVIANGLQSQHN